MTCNRLALFLIKALACVALAAPPIAAGASNDSKAREILAQAERVADWQFAYLEDPSPAATALRATAPPLGWVQGAMYVGVTSLADHSGNPKYAEAVYAHGMRNHWGLAERTFHADDHVIGQTWIWAYEHQHDPQMIASLRERFDSIIAAAPGNSLDFSPPVEGMESGCQLRWCWCDALFMAPPAWIALSRVTGDPKYLAYADREYWATVEKLFDKNAGLFYRDTRFFDRRGEHGEKLFWSRGNGWVYAGLARVLAMLPADHVSRPRYEALFKQMSVALVALQKPDGYWPPSLLQPAKGTPPETSGTGFFTYGLAAGVKSGLLPQRKYRKAAQKGWSALNRAVQPDGKLGWVQPIGAAPGKVNADDTQLFGVGAYLLAATAMCDLYGCAKPQ